MGELRAPLERTRDVSILARDVPAFVAHLDGRWYVWRNAGGVLRLER